SNRLIYDEPVDVEGVAKNIADMAQQFTQYAGVRPFGVALILAGVDKSGTALFLTDPSGTYIGYDAVAIGAGSDQVTEFLEKSYKPESSLQDAASLAIESIYLVSEEKTGSRHVKMAIIDTKTKTMRKVDDDDIEKYAAVARERAGKRGS
ncbi:MAG: archaeal proteasome endopeptidase complex subunit alpha, partial [Nitrososphaera sp.]